MLLGDDWEAFCRVLNAWETDWKSLEVRLGFDTCSQAWRVDHKAPLTDLFTTKTLNAFLVPFRTHVRGIFGFQIQGSVPNDLVEAVTKDVKSKPWDNVLAWLSSLEEEQRIAEQLQSQNKTVEASTIWHRIVDKCSILNYVHMEEPSVRKLFLVRYQKLFFACSLQCALCYLTHLQNPPTGGLANPYHVELVKHLYSHITHAKEFLGPDGQGADGIDWVPGKTDRIRLYLAHCVTLRLGGPALFVSKQPLVGAWDMLKAAHLTDPDNEEIIYEMERWRDWRDELLGVEGTGLVG
jgi:hypothetical protein